MIIASCCVFVHKEILIAAFLTTTGVVLALTLYAMFTKTDFTGCGPYLYGSIWIFLLIGLLTTFKIFPVNVYAYIGVCIGYGVTNLDYPLLSVFDLRYSDVCWK